MNRRSTQRVAAVRGLKGPRMLYVAIATAYVVLAVGMAHAATQVVTTTADPGSGSCGSAGCSLRDALNAAAPNDTVTFAIPATDPGCSSPNVCTIVLDVTQGPIYLSKNVTINGTGQTITLDGSHQTSLLANYADTVSINALTFANAYCTLYACTGANGGSALLNAGHMSVTNSTFHDNSVGLGPYYYGPSGLPHRDGYGGAAIYNEFSAASLTVDRSTFINNSAAGSGGAIYSGGGSVTITNSTFTNNYSSAAGTNTVEDGGGAVANFGPLMNISGSTFAGNSAHEAGAVYNGDTGGSHVLNILNSTLVGNSASWVSGAVSNNQGTLNLINSTLSGNTAPYGGAITNESVSSTVTSTLSISNSIIAQSGAGLDCAPPGIWNFQPVIDHGGNISGDGSCMFLQPTSLNNTVAILGPLQDNGGPTQTMALPASSPAVSLGLGAACPATDQRGVARPGSGQNCSSGAYQYVAPTLSCPINVAALTIAYRSALAASGGNAPYRFSISGGRLPRGLMLDATTGAISGKPTLAGVYSFTGNVTDTSIAGLPSRSATVSCQITVAEPVVRLTANPPSVSFGTVHSLGSASRTVTITNTGNVTVVISGISLVPAGAGSSREIRLLNHCPGSLVAGSSCTLDLMLMPPLGFGPLSMSLTITSNATGSPQSIPVTATVVL